MKLSRARASLDEPACRRCSKPWLLLSALGLLALLWACDDSGTTPNDQSEGPPEDQLVDTDLGDLQPDETELDQLETEQSELEELEQTEIEELEQTEVEDDFELPPPTLEVGEQCANNAQCISGFCMSIAGKFVCTALCDEQTPCEPLLGVDLSCQAVKNPDASDVSVCAPNLGTLCAPCLADINCPAGSCIRISGNPYCGYNCNSNADCPSGTICEEFPRYEDWVRVRQCVPENRTCDCSTENAGANRLCALTDDRGLYVCLGQELCDPSLGWHSCSAQLPTEEFCDGIDNDCNGAIDDGLDASRSCQVSAEGFPHSCQGTEICRGEQGWQCDAPEPSDELCDFSDNDCNGEVDETFKTESGIYVHDEHCGTCNSPCSARFSLAKTTHCEEQANTAVCIIDECIDGYLLQAQNTCVPIASKLCELCQTDADCSDAVGDRCLDYGDGIKFCGRDCSAASPFGNTCPLGYVCDPTLEQCMRSTGDCQCGPGDAFIKPCSQPNPSIPGDKCVGQQSCNNGVLSACTFPGEVCDGADNDCDGVIDNGFVNPSSGLYESDENCGVCNLNCQTLLAAAPHGDGACSTASGSPQCALVCDGGYFDVDGTTANGCECQRLSDSDQPDALGQDANCDSIDGELIRGVFVSLSGSDSNDGHILRPVRSISKGIELAAADPADLLDHVFVANGIYEESLTLASGVHVYGGYSTDFRVHNPVGNETAVFGAAPTVAMPGAVNAFSLSAPTIFDGFTVVGADAVVEGASSYTVYVHNTGNALIFSNNIVVAGNGASGNRGSDGAEGSSPGAAGQNGLRPISVQDLGSPNLFCVPGTTRAAGAGATFSCPLPTGGNSNTHGGAGGEAVCPVASTAKADGSASPTVPGAGNAAG
ncbi:MAG: MopE-related protein, partial [Myxococcota bacterium]|nr:MopE-related protein [Myxococcota bacterium]